MPQFVYNRTQDHVDRLKALQAKGYPNLTAEELVEYTGYAALGAYNATDINRVEAAVAEIAPLYGLTLTTNTSRTFWTLPNKYAGGFHAPTYLSNVVAIRDAALATYSDVTFPDLPESMDNLTWDLANNIEKVLYLAYRSMLSSTLTWDGDISGKDVASGSPLCYKISDVVLTAADVANGASVWAVRNGTEVQLNVTVDTSVDGLINIFDSSNLGIFSVSEDMVSTVRVPSAGTYFARAANAYVSKLVIPGYTGFLKEE